MENYDTLSLVDLRLEGKKLGLKNVTSYRKSELLELVKKAVLQEEKPSEEENNRENDREKRDAYNKKVMQKYGDKQPREVREGSARREYAVREKQQRENSGREYQQRENAGKEYQQRENTGREYQQRENAGKEYQQRENAGKEYQQRENAGKEYQQRENAGRGFLQYSPTEIQQLDSGETRSGILEVMPEGYGFIRCDNYLPGDEDVYVSPAMIRKYQLRTGDILEGHIRIRNQNEKFAALLFVTTVNGVSLEEAVKRPKFERLTPVFPNERIRLETPGSGISMRMMDLIAPIGKGQRGMIVSQPKTGKTTLLKQVAKAVKTNYPSMHLIVLLIDERPEEVTDIKESIMGQNVEVIYSTFDELPENHKRVSEMVIERAKRLVEHGEDVMILLDSITRLARAYNLTVSPSGRTLSGGLDPAALHMPKRFFGAARNMREGGSLTILATALVDTGSKMDDVVFEEFKGTGNMEIVLDRKLSEKRVFPAIDLPKSSTRREDLLMSQEELEATYLMRKAFNGAKSEEAVERIIDMFRKTKTNQDFIQMIKKVKIV